MMVVADAYNPFENVKKRKGKHPLADAGVGWGKKICGPDLTQWVYDAFKSMAAAVSVAAPGIIGNLNLATASKSDLRDAAEALSTAVDSAASQVGLNQIVANLRDYDSAIDMMSKAGLPCPWGGAPCDLSIEVCMRCVKFEFVSNLLYGLAVYSAISGQVKSDFGNAGIAKMYEIFCVAGELEHELSSLGLRRNGGWDEQNEDRSYYAATLGLLPDQVDLDDASGEGAVSASEGEQAILDQNMPKTTDSLQQFCKKVKKMLDNWPELNLRDCAYCPAEEDASEMYVHILSNGKYVLDLGGSYAAKHTGGGGR